MLDKQGYMHALARTRPRCRSQARTRCHTHTNTQYLLLFHGNSGYSKAPQCYVIRTLPIFMFLFFYGYTIEEWRPTTRHAFTGIAKF